VYIETRLSPFGQPIENFLIDSPQVLDTEALGIRPRGMTPVLREDATHLFDWVGAEGYASPVDFIEEARVKGVSRRILPSLVADLTPGSRLLLIHPRAHVRNALDFWRALDANEREHVPCPSAKRGGDNHPDIVAPWLDNKDDLPQPWCLGCCYHDVIGTPTGDPGAVRVTIGDVQYNAWSRPPMTDAPIYAPALFLALPITNVSVIRDPDDAAKVNKLFGQVKDLLGDMPVFLEDS
jgi:hypothetical protein